MRRVAMQIMYDGTDFLGWQRQGSGRTVQEVIETMLSRLCGDRSITIVGAGRTDSGVHAYGQVAHADLGTRYDDDQLLKALQRMSPSDLVIANLSTVDDEFHARYSARRRSYRYRIIRKPDPFLARYAWYLPFELDVNTMNDVALYFRGTHDYTALSKHNPDTPDAVCEVYSAQWHDGGIHLDFHITANRFLYGMVRLLVGVQYDVGRGARGAEEVPEILKSKDRSRQSVAAPTTGLSLIHVDYENSAFQPLY